jgi:hypothetical protein
VTPAAKLRRFTLHPASLALTVNIAAVVGLVGAFAYQTSLLAAIQLLCELVDGLLGKSGVGVGTSCCFASKKKPPVNNRTDSMTGGAPKNADKDTTTSLSR